MSLTSYLRAFGKAASHNAFPDYSSKVVALSGSSISVWGVIGTYTMPYDGLISLNAVSSSATSAAQLHIKKASSGTSISAAASYGSSGTSVRTWVYAEKGETLQFNGSYVNSVWIDVYKVIGGG